MSAGMTRMTRGLTAVDSVVGLGVGGGAVGAAGVGVTVGRPEMVQAVSRMSNRMEAKRIRTASLPSRPSAVKVPIFYLKSPEKWITESHISDVGKREGNGVKIHPRMVLLNAETPSSGVST
jgi:hypothetical protein